MNILYQGAIPNLSTDQMREVDRAMIEDYGIELLQMMENAGRSLASFARDRFLEGDAARRRIVILAGNGANGGGALVSARHLHNYGAHVHVYLADTDNLTPAADHQLAILERMGVPIRHANDIVDEHIIDLIIDGLIGYSLQDAPYGIAAKLIRWANAADVPVLALDVPSGIDATTGEVFIPAIRASATMTLALPKAGLFAANAVTQVGELYLADIGVPRELYAQPPLHLDIPNLFSQCEIIRLR